jgi:hypothetical protein
VAFRVAHLVHSLPGEHHREAGHHTNSLAQEGRYIPVVGERRHIPVGVARRTPVEEPRRRPVVRHSLEERRIPEALTPQVGAEDHIHPVLVAGQPRSQPV